MALGVLIQRALDGLPDTASSLPVGEPHLLASMFVTGMRRRRRLSAEENLIKSHLAKVGAALFEHIKAGRWSRSSEVDGANVHTKKQVFASPAKTLHNGEEVADHARLTEVLNRLAAEQPEETWTSLLPSKVNSQTLSAMVNEYLDNKEFTEDQELLEVEERLVIAGCPRELVEAMHLTEKQSINANKL